MIKTREVRRLGRVAHVVEKKNACKFVMGNLKSMDHLKYIDANRIILKLILKKHGGGAWTGFVWLRIWGER
jgi:hypothetical protein